jgi:hypothetical protein
MSHRCRLSVLISEETRDGVSLGHLSCVRFRLCMSMEWMNECVDWLFITQLLKGMPIYSVHELTYTA